MWQQRSRISWLTAGDKNTRFFHLRASQRRRKNRISKLKRPDGQLTEDLLEMGDLISSFYKELYTSEGTEDMASVLNTVPTKVTPEMNDQLLAPFTEKEVKEAEASPHKRRLKCDTKHQSQEADATFITSDGSKPYKPWRTLDTDNDNN